MAKVWLYGHWLSENLGDRYQPRAIAEYIVRYVDLSFITFVNFFPDDKPMSIELCGKEWPVFSPEEVYLNQPSPELIILVTGSIDRTMSYIPWLSRFLETSGIEIIVWGGFAHVSSPEEFREGLEVLGDRRITFWARSWLDLDMYQKMFPIGRCELSGDPMAIWAFNRDIKINPAGPRVIIVSIHAWKYHPEIWSSLIQKGDILLSIDPYDDAPLKREYPHLKIIRTPEDLFAALQGCSQVISGRLHGGLLSALAKVPTTLVIIDDALSGKGSFKFEAVGTSGSGQNRELCQVVLSKDLGCTLLPPEVKTEACEDYFILTIESMGRILSNLRRLNLCPYIRW